MKQNGSNVVPNLEYRLVVGREIDSVTNKIKDIEYVITWEGPERKTYVGEDGQIYIIRDAEEDRNTEHLHCLKESTILH